MGKMLKGAAAVTLGVFAGKFAWELLGKPAVDLTKKAAVKAAMFVNKVTTKTDPEGK